LALDDAGCDSEQEERGDGRMGIALFSRRKKLGAETDQTPSGVRSPARDIYEPAEPLTLSDDPLERHVQLERFGFVLRHGQQWRGHARAQSLFADAAAAIDEHFAMVPEGFVSIAQTTHDGPGCPEVDVETVPFLLARRCVTNESFQKFVDGGGYADLNLWPEDLWPHLIDFKDQTEQPGPRFWRDGRHDKRFADHPVVGICYYEAAAYAAWAGYRLPTGAEWQMAASWRIRSSAHVMRRYPWGDALDTRRCNIWASNIAHTVSVGSYEAGAAPNGVLQLVGNVWEWTGSDYTVHDEGGRMVVGDMLLMEVRGGAYDTYFASQATSQFRTGLAALSRVHNVGLRCALDLAASDG